MNQIRRSNARGFWRCPIDAVVVDNRGFRHRPWLTLITDRASRAILGFHIGFDWPSYATVQRALIHSISVKDLSGISGLQNEWPCHGRPKFVITDRGLEFLSESLSAACRDLGIEIVNLRGRCPHLKGSVERMFGTMNVKVFDILDGAVKSRLDEHYDPYHKARFSLEELTEKIVRWIVDDYHTQPHVSVGMSPLQKWNELSKLYGITPVRDFQHLVVLFGERIRRKIGNTGIEFEYHTYNSQELVELRKRRGGLKKDWQIRVDPYCRGCIWILDDEKRRWLTVPAAHQFSSKGISKFASKRHRVMVRQLTTAGGEITDTMLSEAIEFCRVEAKTSSSKRAARYHADGALATQVVGSCGILGSVLGVTKDAARHAPPAFKTTNGSKTSFNSRLNELVNRRLEQDDLLPVEKSDPSQ